MSESFKRASRDIFVLSSYGMDTFSESSLLFYLYEMEKCCGKSEQMERFTYVRVNRVTLSIPLINMPPLFHTHTQSSYLHCAAPRWPLIFPHLHVFMGKSDPSPAHLTAVFFAVSSYSGLWLPPASLLHDFLLSSPITRLSGRQPRDLTRTGTCEGECWDMLPRASHS